jgi:hypothetical protein
MFGVLITQIFQVWSKFKKSNVGVIFITVLLHVISKTNITNSLSSCPCTSSLHFIATSHSPITSQQTTDSYVQKETGETEGNFKELRHVSHKIIETDLNGCDVILSKKP